jgi:hypothetical protein
MGKELKAEEGIKVLKCPKGKGVQTLASRVFPVHDRNHRINFILQNTNHRQNLRLDKLSSWMLSATS